MDAHTDRSIAELYAQPLDSFIAARDKLAAELRAAGDERAAQIKKLRKPGLPVWAVNRLAAERPGDFAALLAIGAKLREAHADLLAGGDADAVRTLAAEERQIVAGLAGHARTVLESAGQSPSASTLERISETLFGLATDLEAAEAAKAGRLDHDVARGGFGESDSFEAAEPPDEVRVRRVAATAAKANIRRAREAAEKARRRADELTRRAEELTRQAEDLAAEAQKVAGRAISAREAADAANTEAVEAEREADRVDRGTGTK